jgi:single-strand DNA-binding protein
MLLALLAVSVSSLLLSRADPAIQQWAVEAMMGTAVPVRKAKSYCDRYGHTWRPHPTDSRYEVCIYTTGRGICGVQRRVGGSSSCSHSMSRQDGQQAQKGQATMTQTATPKTVPPKTDDSIWNQLILTGNLGQDPEMSFTHNGTAVTKFSLGVNQGKEKPTMWVNVETWRELAEDCNKNLAKGAKVEITGRLVQDVWTDKEGKTRRNFKAVAQTVRVLKRSAAAARGSGFIDERAGGDDLGDLDDDPF